MFSNFSLTFAGQISLSDLKSYKVIGFLNTFQHGVPFYSVYKGVVYLAFTPFATIVGSNSWLLVIISSHFRGHRALMNTRQAIKQAMEKPD